MDARYFSGSKSHNQTLGLGDRTKHSLVGELCEPRFPWHNPNISTLVPLFSLFGGLCCHLLSPVPPCTTFSISPPPDRIA